MIRYGKSSGALLAHKKGFFAENDGLLNEGRRIGAVYTQQPRRTACKCCDAPLEGPRFTKQGIEYVLCGRCGHLNGAHEDTDAFCEAMYVQDGGASYAKTYSSADKDAYRARVRDIYVPKAEFLRDALSEAGETPETLRFADLGAGSGYFVAAMRNIGWPHSHGYEVSDVQVALAQAMISEDAVKAHALDAAAEIAGTVEADVVSMIGVLEHVQNPRDIVAALRSNPNVRYFYISVPLFSPRTMIECAFPEVFQRQLSAGHTHLYTEGSIDWMCREFGLSRLSEWWFGTDMVDFYRSVAVELERNSETAALAGYWREMIVPALDEAQLALDTRKTASEVHLLMRFAD